MKGIRDRLKKINESGKVPHAFLFVGSDAGFLESLSVEFSTQLLFSSMNDDSNHTLLKRIEEKVAEKNHPDFRLLEPEKQEITIEQIREFQRFFSIAPYEARRKIGIIKKADTLNRAASNSLLKLLEEPPPFATVLLLAKASENLLPTLRSRSCTIRIMPELDEGTAKPQIPAWTNELDKILIEKGRMNPSSAFSFTSKIAKNKEELPFFFSIFEKAIRDELVPDESRTYVPPAKKLETLFDEALLAEEDTLRRYGNVGLALDELLLSWKAVWLQ